MKRDDFFAQLLRANGDPGLIQKIIQEKCRRKAAKKLAATLSLAPDFTFPTELSAEQCTADDVAEFHASLVDEGVRVVDLTAGLGIDDFHLARKASEVVSIEMNPQVEAAIEPNARALGLNNLRSVCCDSTQWIKECDERFDVAFIDPARRGDDGSRLYSLSQCRPNVIEMLDDIQRIAPRLLIKASPMLDISKVIGELRCVAAVYAVGTRSECKELLIDIVFGYDGPARICAATVGTPIVELKKTVPVYAETLEPGDIIGEPWPAVMKIRPDGLCGAEQLHPSTLLFRNPGVGFPGELYRIERIEEFSSSTLRRLSREEVRASVATRNFPMTADRLREKLRARENSDCRLMATTLSPSRQVLIFMTKICCTFRDFCVNLQDNDKS